MMMITLGSAVFAQAVIRDLSGTVEVKAPGAGDWVPAQRGETLAKDGLISTGFRSTAVLLVGNSTLMVRPLTRLSVEELVEIQGSEQVRVNLQTGRVRAEVAPPAGGRTDFTVKAPSATASVRGTVFEFDTLNLTVANGTVELSSSDGTSVRVEAGGASFVNEATGAVASPEETAAAGLVPTLPVGSDSGAAVTPDKPQAPIQGGFTMDFGW
jgi:hypothetical protein